MHDEHALSDQMISEAELRRRLTNFEDPFVERKVASDVKDCLKTCIAFANTLPNGIPGVMFIPVKNDGTIQAGVNLDELQRSISKRLASAYPDLLYFQRVVSACGGEVVAVVVPGSPQRPHFAGHAYVRNGSESIKASAAQFDLLIARRSAMVDELEKWVNKPIIMHSLRSANATSGHRVSNSYDEAELLGVTQWWVTIRYFDGRARNLESFALARVQLSYDPKRDRLIVEIAN